MDKHIGGAVDDQEDVDVITKDSGSQSEFHDCLTEPSRPTPSLFGRIPLPQLRPFDKENVERWFKELDTQLMLCKATTEGDRYVVLLGHVDYYHHSLIESWLADGPVEAATTPFTFVKEKLLIKYRINEHERVQRIISARPGNRTMPSEFLMELKQLAGGAGQQTSLVRETWLKHLHPVMIGQFQLPMMIDLPLDSLAAFADVYHKSISHTPAPVPAIPAPVPEAIPRAMMVDTNSVDARLERLEILLTSKSFEPKKHAPRSLQTHPRQQEQRPSRPPQQPGNSNNNSSQPNGTCWYHVKFGNRARKCECPKNE